jgi:hypothetical protein
VIRGTRTAQYAGPATAISISPESDRACGFRSSPSQAIVLACAPRVLQNRRMHGRSCEPSLGPWTFSEHIYGIAHCLIDRDGCVIGCNLPIGNGLLLEQAPAMAARSEVSVPIAGLAIGRLPSPRASPRSQLSLPLHRRRSRTRLRFW